MTPIKAIVDGIKIKSKPQMLEHRYEGFRNRRCNNDVPSKINAKNKTRIY